MLIHGLSRDTLRLILAKLDLAHILQLYCACGPTLSAVIERL